jgi:hypothetical protein
VLDPILDACMVGGRKLGEKGKFLFHAQPLRSIATTAKLRCPRGVNPRMSRLVHQENCDGNCRPPYNLGHAEIAGSSSGYESRWPRTGGRSYNNPSEVLLYAPVPSRVDLTDQREASFDSPQRFRRISVCRATVYIEAVNDTGRSV